MGSPDTPAVDPVSQAAAEWIVMLTADDEAEREQARRDFLAWKRADPRHEAAAAGMEDLIARLQSVNGGAGGDGRPARAALRAAFPARRSRARHLGTALALACALALPAGLWLQARPPAYLMADLRTDTGQWATHTLPDGSRITLDGGSAVNLRYGAGQRVVELVRGAILVDVARDASRPFLVETRDGSIRALGTRFEVDKALPDATVLSMLESRVVVRPGRAPVRADEGHGPGSVQVGAGQRVRITPAGVGPVERVDAQGIADAWARHQLVVSDRPLAEVLDLLARQRRGYVRYDHGQIDGIRVSAVLPLDDPDRALRLLASSFPQLRMRTLTPYLVLVDAPPRP